MAFCAAHLYLLPMATPRVPTKEGTEQREGERQGGTNTQEPTVQPTPHE